MSSLRGLHIPLTIPYLNIIVEGAVYAPVLLEEPESVGVAKVFELDECVLPIAPHYRLFKSKTIIKLKKAKSVRLCDMYIVLAL